MVSRTRIPTSMYPSDYTPSTPSGEVTPASMTKDGSGEPILKNMIEDYPCGSEPGHSFRSSPLNIYSLGRDSSVVLYVEGGCANFTWESDNAWATFGTAETAVRYNTLTSSADEGQDTVVTVTDSNGLEVTINILYNDVSTCCEDPPALSFQTDIDDVVDEWNSCDVVTFIDGGCPPFAWETTVIGAGSATLDYAATNSRRNRVTGNATCWTLTVTDACGSTSEIGVYPITEFDNYEFDEDTCISPRAIQLSTNYYAVVYESANDDGWIKTFHIPSTTGVITEIDSYEYDTTNGANPSIVHVTGNVYAIVNNSTYLFTVIISDTGVITKAIQDSEQVNAGANYFNVLQHVDDSIYAVFWGSSSGRRISTYSIDSEGTITYVDTYTSSVSKVIASVVQVTISKYALVYLNDWGTFVVLTFEIDGAGDITEAILDNQSFTLPGEGRDVSHGRTCVIEVGSNVFAMTHGDNTGLSLATFQVNDDGSIGTSLIDSLVDLDPNAGESPWIVYSGSGDVYYIIHQGAGDDGYINSVRITSAGAISAYSPCGGFEFETSFLANGAVALSPEGDMLPIFYMDGSTDGWLRTMNLGG